MPTLLPERTANARPASPHAGGPTSEGAGQPLGNADDNARVSRSWRGRPSGSRFSSIVVPSEEYTSDRPSGESAAQHPVPTVVHPCGCDSESVRIASQSATAATPLATSSDAYGSGVPIAKVSPDRDVEPSEPTWYTPRTPCRSVARRSTPPDGSGAEACVTVYVALGIVPGAATELTISDGSLKPTTGDAPGSPAARIVPLTP